MNKWNNAPFYKENDPTFKIQNNCIAASVLKFAMISYALRFQARKIFLKDTMQSQLNGEA